MKMFVANSTKQIVNFLYRVTEFSGVRAQEIPIGGQVQLSGDLTREQIDGIIVQHSRYGMVEAAELDRVRDFAGIIYSIDKPVQSVKIERLIHHNTDKLIEAGRKIRQESAISSNQQLEQSLGELPHQEVLRNFEMSVVEENHDERDTTPALAEGVRITRGADAPAPKTARRRR